ncbi:MAG: zinc-dependent peptidase [Ferruginibacter sp.]
MPFDTTYVLINDNRSVRIEFTIPGGADTSIYLSPGQLPSDIDSMFSAGDSPARQVYEVLLKEESASRLKVPKPYTPGTEFIFFFLLIFALIMYNIWKRSEVDETYSQTIFPGKKRSKAKPLLTYYGDELDFSDQQLSAILTLRFPYYNSLSQTQQKIFLGRLQKFISQKTFRIHGEKGFKEMPVLISAAAIQLTFGLKRYLLPHFTFIHIHPQEFLRVRPILCFLEGNVSGHSINLSWKHFLEGYATPNNGQNVGLHELAHALYYQTFVVEENVDTDFRDQYDSFNIDGNKAYDTERTVEGGLYSEYAEKNFQEFWAESAELFFEKPDELKSHYPQLYQTMSTLLNQDPISGTPSMIGQQPG